MKEAWIRKFTGKQIFVHWLFAVCWLVLVLTGALFLWRPDPHGAVTGLGVYLQGSVGQVLRTVHRVAAVGFMLAPVLYLVLEPRLFFRDLRDLVTITRDDLRFFVTGPVFYTTGKGHVPPQGRYNGGHKLNYWIVILTWAGFVVSGLTMWLLRGVVSAETFRLMLLIHSVSFFVGLAMGLLHIYLSLIHPFTRQALSAMTTGYVRLSYARLEHGRWVDEELRRGTADVREAPPGAGAV